MSKKDKLFEFAKFLWQHSLVVDHMDDYQDLYRSNLRLDWLLDLNTLMWVVDRVLTPVELGFSSLDEEHDDYIEKNKRPEPVHEQDEKYDVIFTFSVAKIKELCTELNDKQICFILLYVYHKRIKKLGIEREVTDSFYIETYLTDNLQYKIDMEKFIKARPYFNVNEYISALDLNTEDFNLEKVGHKSSKLSQTNYLFVLYSTLFFGGVKLTHTSRGKDNEYDILTDLGNYIHDSNTSIKVDEIKGLLKRFTASPNDEQRLAVTLCNLFSACEVPSIKKGNAKKYLNLAFDFKVLENFQSVKNKKKLEKRLSGFPSLLKEFDSYKLTVKNFFSFQ